MATVFVVTVSVTMVGVETFASVLPARKVAEPLMGYVLGQMLFSLFIILLPVPLDL